MPPLWVPLLQGVGPKGKRVRDLEVSGRRTTLVWRRRRFECGNCGERHLEDHAEFQAGLTRRFARRLVKDATVMSIRAVARHHGVGWHRIMGLVRAHSERVAQRRRARPCRVLLVDETSIRRRHRYVTVVACGDSDVTPSASTGPPTRRVGVPRTYASVATCPKAG